jgi:hypothetical protein
MAANAGWSLICCDPMDWQAHPNLYQFLHPWHWLAYGNNAAALTCVVSLVAFIGLFFYTLYTRKMMWIAQQSRNSELMPYFVLNSVEELNTFRSKITLMNLGAHAVNARFWQQPVSKNFSITPIFLENSSSIPTVWIGPFKKDTTSDFLMTHNAIDRFLVVIDYEDTAQQRHQSRIFRIQSVNNANYQVNNLIPTAYLPFWRGLRIRIRNWWVQK